MVPLYTLAQPMHMHMPSSQLSPAMESPQRPEGERNRSKCRSPSSPPSQPNHVLTLPRSPQRDE